MHLNVHTHFSKDPLHEIVNLQNVDEHFPFFSVGIHPWLANDPPISNYDIELLAQQPNCLAIGEVGLDKLKGPSIAIQEERFIEQITFSETLELPVILHCVRAWNEIRALKLHLKPTQPWIYHGFSKASLVPELLHCGIYFSIGASILTNIRLQEALIDIPLDQLFLETDDVEIPISLIYEKVSALKNIPLPALEDTIENNFKRVFKKWTIGLSAQSY